MIGRIHSSNGRAIFSLCDDELIDKVFEEGDKQLDLTADFFKGETVTDGTTLELMGQADILFVVGEESVAFAIKKGIVEQQHIKRIADVPYAQIVRM